MKTLLLVTTPEDISLPLFQTDTIRTMVDVHIAYFSQPVSAITSLMQSTSFDYIYIRDPFNASYEKNDITQKITAVLVINKHAYIVDHITTSDDIFFEDKWRQYSAYHQFMPYTELLSSENSSVKLPYIIKQRISSRARGIYFNRSSISPQTFNDYIIQQAITIQTEYRVYVLKGTIISPVAVRQPKTAHQKVKIDHVAPPPSALRTVVQKIISTNKYDLVGLDIAQDQYGAYWLLEINRSPQFATYFQKSGINLAEALIKQLPSHISPRV